MRRITTFALAVALVPCSAFALEIDLATTRVDWTAWGAWQGYTGKAGLIDDFNGDGVLDLLIVEGERYVDPPPHTPASPQRARWCMYFGPLTFPTEVDLRAVTPAACIHSWGNAYSEEMARAADLDGDGLVDLVLGVSSSLDTINEGRGLVAVFRGRTAWPADLDYLADADWVFQGADLVDAMDRGTVGDLNGDGHVDLAMFGAGAARPGDTVNGAGVGYLFLGPPARWSKRVYELAVDAPDTLIVGAPNDQLAFEAKIENLLGDGTPDLIMAAPSWGRTPGAPPGKVYVLRGRGSWPSVIDLAIPGTADLEVVGPASQSYLRAVSVADWDADGVRDLLIGAPQWTSAPAIGGAVFVLYGKSGLSGVWDLASRPADVTFVGARSNAWFGYNVEPGDVNGDGFTDIIVAAVNDPTPALVRNGFGAVEVLYGCEGGGPAWVDLAVDPPRLSIWGADGPTASTNGDSFGQSLSVRDLNQDGRDDILAGAPWSASLNNTRDWAGEAHVILGPGGVYPPVCTVAADAGPGADVCAGSPVTLDGSATSVSGCSKTPQYRWKAGRTIVRDWSLDPTAVVRPLVDTIYRLEVRCGDCAGPCFGSGTVSVTTRPDPIPPDQGNVIRAVRRGQDAALTFVGAPATWWRMYRDESKLALGTTALAPDVAVTSFDDPGAVPPPPELLFYRVKGLSPCSFTPGP